MNERISILRKELKLSQSDFGKKIGLSQRAISDIENGNNGLSERNFNAICKAFSVNPEWLRTGVGDMFIETREALLQSVVDEYDLTPKEAALIRTFLDLPPKFREGVLIWAENFATVLGAQMGIDYTPPSRRTKPDSALTADEAGDVVKQEWQDMLDAQKRATTTSPVSTGTNGTSKKFGKPIA